MTTRDLILHHVGASGPVSFRSIAGYVREQYPWPVEDWFVAEVLNQLLAKQIIRLYDTGDAFDAGPKWPRNS